MRNEIEERERERRERINQFIINLGGDGAKICETFDLAISTLTKENLVQEKEKETNKKGNKIKIK